MFYVFSLFTLKVSLKEFMILYIWTHLSILPCHNSRHVDIYLRAFQMRWDENGEFGIIKRKKIIFHSCRSFYMNLPFFYGYYLFFYTLSFFPFSFFFLYVFILSLFLLNIIHTHAHIYSWYGKYFHAYNLNTCTYWNRRVTESARVIIIKGILERVKKDNGIFNCTLTHTKKIDNNIKFILLATYI